MFRPAASPTLYFIGVTTGASSMMRIFPEWMERLGRPDARLVGVDLPLAAEPARYREWVAHIKRDPQSLGALVTSHKLDVLSAAGDLFESLDPFARAMGEVSSIYKREGRLYGAAVDAETADGAMAAFAPEIEGDVLVLGGGGAALAIVWALLGRSQPPRRIQVTDIAEERLAHVRQVCSALPGGDRVQTILVESGRVADDRLAELPPGSMVVNATGMGKDRPGSPLGDAALWPENGIAWELNYRGARPFLHQARSAKGRGGGLVVEDGWRYFLLGWTRVIGMVFGVEIPADGPLFARLSKIASAYRPV